MKTKEQIDEFRNTRIDVFNCLVKANHIADWLKEQQTIEDLNWILDYPIEDYKKHNSTN